MVKNLPKMREIWVRSLGWKDPLEKEMAIHSSILAWRIPRALESGGLQSNGYFFFFFFFALAPPEKPTQMAQRCSVKVLCIVPECKKAVLCFIEKIRLISFVQA